MGERPGTKQGVTNGVIIAIVTCQHTRVPRLHTLLMFLGAIKNTPQETHHGEGGMHGPRVSF